VCLPGALSPIGGRGEIQGKGWNFPGSKSSGPNSNALAYAERALSTWGGSTWALITLLFVNQSSQFFLTQKRYFFLKTFNSLSISLSVSKTFVLKLKSFPKLRRIFGRLLPSQVLMGLCPSNIVPNLSCLDSGTSCAKVSLGYIP